MSKIKPLNLLSIGFPRQVWHLGWEPTVSCTLVDILHRLNDVMIQGSLFEISPSTTLKPGSTALGTGVGIYYFLPQMLYIDLIQRLDISTCQVQQLFGMVMLPVLWLFSD